MAFKLLLRVGPFVSPCKRRRQQRMSNRRPSRSNSHPHLAEPIPVTALASDATLSSADAPVGPPSEALDSAEARSSQQEAHREQEVLSESATSASDSKPQGQPKTAIPGAKGKPRKQPESAASASARLNAAADGLGDGSAGLLPHLPGMRALSFAELLDQFDEWIGTKRVYEAMNRAAAGAHSQSASDSSSGSDSDCWVGSQSPRHATMAAVDLGITAGILGLAGAAS